MRLIKALPETKQALVEGTLSLSTASQLHGFFENERKQNAKSYEPEQKRKILEQVQGRSKRECEKVFAALSPCSSKPEDSTRVVAEDQYRISFVGDEVLLQKLEKIKGLIAHRNPNPSYAELFSIMADLVLKKIDPEKSLETSSEKNEVKEEASTSLERWNPKGHSSLTSPARPKCKESSKQIVALQQTSTSRYIPAALKKAVWQEAQGRCTYTDPRTKHRCESTHMLEIDHALPLALGGQTELQNLRLVCRAHNQFLALQAFGKAKMQQFTLNTL